MSAISTSLPPQTHPAAPPPAYEIPNVLLYRWGKPLDKKFLNTQPSHSYLPTSGPICLPDLERSRISHDPVLPRHPTPVLWISSPCLLPRFSLPAPISLSLISLISPTFKTPPVTITKILSPYLLFNYRHTLFYCTSLSVFHRCQVF